MARKGSTPYGSSKAALELASDVWAKDLESADVTVNVLNPGAGAHTVGIAESFKRTSRGGPSRPLH